MKKVANFLTSSIQRKILSSLAGIIALVVVTAAAGYHQLDQVRRYSLRIVPDGLQMELAQNFALSLSALDADIERFLVIQGQEARETVGQDFAEMERTLQLLKGNDAGATSPVLRELEALTEELEAETENLIQSVDLESGEINRQIVSLYDGLDRSRELQQQLTRETIDRLVHTVQRQYRIASNVIRQFLILGTSVFVLVILVSFLLSQMISKPIVRLTKGAIAVAKGHLNTRIEIVSNDELGQLARSFNHMVTSIQQAEAALLESRARYQELNQALEQRVSERTAELQAVNKELEAFAYSVSHDLRAPLRSINGFSQALLEDYGAQLDAQAWDYLRRVQAASQRMAQLIDDLLTLSRLTRQEMRRERVDLSALARSIASELRGRAPQRVVEFVIAEGIEAQGDPQLLRIALTNLLENAWKFTGKHASARIEFGTQELEGEKVYFVRDDGAGFDMAYTYRLFGAFQRLHSAVEFEGTGIGLATVQRVILRHGGRVWAEGKVERGATFFFTLSD